MGVWLGPMGSNKPVSQKKDISYQNGTWDFFIDEQNPENWELVLFSSGILRFKKKPNEVDIFMVGPGGKGDDGLITVDNRYGLGEGDGGKGGNGGECIINNTILQKGINYTVTIGTTGSQYTSINEIQMIAYGGNHNSWSSNNGNEGGSGTHTNSTAGSGTIGNGISGMYAFNSNSNIYGKNILYGASGGGGATAHDYKNDPNRGYTSQNGGKGADTGSGKGGNASSDAGAGNSASISNTGAGGGGGAVSITSNGNSDRINKFGIGGSGASGIIIIRNHRSS